MDSYNILWLEWSIGSLLVCISGLLVLNYSDLLPNFIHRIVKYGKSANSHSKLQFLELPKRYFFHFYSVALIFYIFLLSLAIGIYFGDSYSTSPYFLRKTLDYFAKYDIFTNYRYVVSPGRPELVYQRAASVSPESVLIGLSLLIIQVTRRLYECLMISVYSNARMNIVHYLFGHLFYIGVGLSMLAEAPGFTGQSISFKPNQYNFLTVCHIVGISFFLWSSYIQYDCHKTLANLRKDTNGRVYTTKHMIPKGNWFELVSCPHYMAEIMIYLAITIVLSGKSSTWWMVFLFVITNQIFVGKFNHYWYLGTFKDYPKSRKAVIPYVI